ncbi:MAG: YwaF family protein [Mogibacterium sp.]|nr:YwaF family protein [Mogibacterium sp.]
MSSVEESILRILQTTAIPMKVPPLYGAFHILLVAVLVFAAVTGAWCLRNCSERTRIRALAAAGWFLILTEVYKQLFFYYIVNGRVYDYWYLPFQLCSVPMYLCVLLPFTHGKIRSAFLTFMLGYTFVSAAATFVYPADLMRPYLILTLHGFLWHGILLWISLVIGFAGMADLTVRGFTRSTVLFLVLCGAATGLNILTEPYAAAAAAHGVWHAYPNAFYLNPYHLSSQPLVGTVQEAIGIPAGLLLYIAAIILVSGLVDLAFRRRIPLEQTGRHYRQ